METIRLGIVGTGNISEWFINGCRKEKRCAVAAVCSRDLSRAGDFARKHGIARSFDSLEEMVAGDEVDAVYIATPNSCHAWQSILCMRHGKHVLCEKPLASNRHEVTAMIEASRQNGVVLMEAMKTTVTPNFRHVIDNIARAGKIRRYFSSYCQYSSRYDDYKKGIVRNAFRPELSNGAVMDIGIYTIYPMVVLFGKPQEIAARGMILPSGVDGQGCAFMKYDGMDAEIIYSKIADSYLPSEIQGEDATISIDNIHDMRDIRCIGRRGCLTEDWKQGDYVDDYYYEAAEFIDVILSGQIESSINSHANSLATIEITDEIRRQNGIIFPADSTRDNFCHTDGSGNS